MNQRAHIRRPVQMPARISNTDFSDRPCEVRDFCLGGMLLTVPASEKSLMLSLTQGEQLTVAVDVQGLRGLAHRRRHAIRRCDGGKCGGRGGQCTELEQVAAGGAHADPRWKVVAHSASAPVKARMSEVGGADGRGHDF